MRTQSIRVALAVVLLSPCAFISIGGFMFSRTSFRQSREQSYLRKFCLIIISLALVSIHIQAQNGWTKKADMLTPRAGASACVVNNKIYVIGGMSSYLGDSDANEVYDPSTNTWETKQPMPTKRSFLLTGVVNDTIYAIGGGYPTSTKETEAYDPATNTWTTKKDMLFPWFGVFGVTVNEKIYTMGGNYNERNCFEYDPRLNEWKYKTSIPVGRCAGPLSATVYGGLVYAFGGTTKYPFYGTTDPKEPLSTVDVYNPQMDTWDTTKVNMPTPRYALSTFLVNDTIYAIGGTQSRGTTLSAVEAYDPFTNTWGSKPNMPFKGAWMSGTVFNNKIYVFGRTIDWVAGDGSVWEYDPAYLTGVASPLESPKGFVLEQNYPNPFNPSTTIRYGLPHKSLVRLTVYNLLGQEVATLVQEAKEAGYQEVRFDGSGLASGVYIYRLQAGDFVQTKKLIILK